MVELSEHYFDETDSETKEYVNFKPVWNNGEWTLVSTKTNKVYSPLDFLKYDNDSPFESYYKEYSEKVRENTKYDVSPVFMFVWLKKFQMFKALEHRENLRKDYLNTNLVPGLSSKEASKVNRNSEKTYETGYSKYFEQFLEY